MKHTDWKARTDKYLLSMQDVPFQWGVNDCYMFVANVVEEMSGMDIAHWLRGQYHDKRGAITEVRKLSKTFDGSMIKMFDEALTRKEPADASYGDVVMAYIKNLDPEATGRTSGIISDSGDMLVPGKLGLVAIKDPTIDYAWHVPETNKAVMKNWPVVTGCYRISHGCFSCPSYWEYLKDGKDYSIKIHDEELLAPSMNTVTTTYNVAFGSDLFHEDVPVNFIARVFQIMNSCPQHNFEIITKRINQVFYLGMIVLSFWYAIKEKKTYLIIALTGYVSISFFTASYERVFAVLMLMTFIALACPRKSIRQPRILLGLLIFMLVVFGFRFRADIWNKELKKDPFKMTHGHSMFSTLTYNGVPWKWFDGIINFENKKYDLAKQQLYLAHEYNPYNIYVMNGMGIAAIIENKRVFAKEHFNRALEICPDFKEAKENLARLQ